STQLAPIDDAHGLAFAPRDLPVLEHIGADANAELLPQHTLDRGLQAGGVDVRAGRLALHGELVHHALAVDDELIVRRNVRNGEQRVLDVGGVDVDAAHDDHVVAPALQAVDPR